MSVTTSSPGNTGLSLMYRRPSLTLSSAFIPASDVVPEMGSDNAKTVATMYNTVMT